EYGTYDWLSCTWPPTPDADADGFTHIHVDAISGPGEGDASDSNIRDVITGSCRTYQVTYDFEHMVDMERGKPVVVPLGMVTSIDDLGHAWTPKDNNGEWPFYPGRDEVDVLRNDHYAPANMACGTAKNPA